MYIVDNKGLKKYIFSALVQFHLFYEKSSVTFDQQKVCLKTFTNVKCTLLTTVLKPANTFWSFLLSTGVQVLGYELEQLGAPQGHQLHQSTYQHSGMFQG